MRPRVRGMRLSLEYARRWVGTLGRRQFVGGVLIDGQAVERALKRKRIPMASKKYYQAARQFDQLVVTILSGLGNRSLDSAQTKRLLVGYEKQIIVAFTPEA